MKNAIYAALIISMIGTAISCANADNNSFFGANPGAGSGSSGSSSGNNQDYSKDLPEDSNPNAVLPGLNETAPTKPNNMSDFTGDEKRMQKKYKANIASAQRLIIRGDGMMKAARNNVNSPVFKKGKILKEIGEKTLTDLKANNPFPDQKIK
jgi:hypothetical protein